MKLPIAKGRIPYGGKWTTTDRLSGQVFSAPNWDSLINQIVSARIANGLPTGLGMEKEIEQWVCQDMPKECDEWNPAIPRKPRELGLGDVLHGTMVAFSHVVHGRPTVSQEEAERRAAICVGCRYNVNVRGGCTTGCGPLLELMKKIIGGATTSNDSKLKACHICSCDLKSAVWSELAIQCQGVTAQQRVQFASLNYCWKQCSD